MQETTFQIVQNYKNHLHRLGYNKSSVQMLPSCLKEFLKFTGKPVKFIEANDITNYHEYLQNRPNRRRSGGLSESYITHHIYSLKLFFTWQQELRNITENPMNAIAPTAFKTPEHKPREILSSSEIKALYDACETLQQRAILSLYYGCGLRRSEGVALNLKDVRFRSNLLYVRDGKGGKRRVVPMSASVKKDLWKYVLKERTSKTETAFLIGKMGGRLSGERCNKILKELLKRSNIEDGITLHALRHSIATHLLDNGLSVEYVRDFLGHKHLESTQIYTRVRKENDLTLFG